MINFTEIYQMVFMTVVGVVMTTKTTKKTEDKVDFSIAERWNGIAAIVGCGALIVSYSLSGQIIPGFV